MKLGIRTMKTSDLIVALVNPALLTSALEQAGDRDDEAAVEKAANEVIAEIDRRIPVPIPVPTST